MKKGLFLHISIQSQLLSTDCQVQLPKEVADLLLEFNSMFATPVGLSPLRDHEHHINLKKGAQSIC